MIECCTKGLGDHVQRIPQINVLQVNLTSYWEIPLNQEAQEFQRVVSSLVSQHLLLTMDMDVIQKNPQKINTQQPTFYILMPIGIQLGSGGAVKVTSRPVNKNMF